MKKILVLILIVCVFFSLAFFLTFNFFDCLENQKPTLIIRKNVYPASMIVTEIDYENDLVTITDFCGQMYSFYGCDDWAINDICAVIMDNYGTPDNIQDDIILQVKYCGWIK